MNHWFLSTSSTLIVLYSMPNSIITNRLAVRATENSSYNAYIFREDAPRLRNFSLP